VIASSGLALPQGYALNEYRIESTLGIGGFGLTYLATDGNLNLQVAIKEYLPGEFALRSEDQSVKPKSDSTVDTFKWGLSRFLDESRTLASFRHPNIVRVMRFFEANQTAYMVMEFVAGQPLHDWARARRPLTEQAVLAVAGPLLDGLEVVHRAKYLHRDIKPNNIFIRDDLSPVLIDFGSARVTNTNTEMTSIVTPGYAPFEQYYSQGKQGPWSDLYSVGAVLYWMVTGNKPTESVARIKEDFMLPASQVGDRARYSAELLGAIDWALSPLENARPQSVAEFRNVLRGLAQLPPAATPTEQVAQRPAPAAAAAFEPEILEKVGSALASHIGPIASRVVRSVARKSVTLAQLVESVATEITDDKARVAFVKKFAGADKSVPTRPPAADPAGETTLRPGPPPQRFDSVTLAKAEAALAKYIGAVARVIVPRAAASARDEAELYLLLAEQIENKSERKAFVNMADSAPSKE
jgi:serine/threonine protein kinase